MSTATFTRRLWEVNGPKPPEVDGMGYVTTEVVGGAGFNYTRRSRKGDVFLSEHFPSPLLPEQGITSCYTVYLGQTDFGEHLPCPFECPATAQSWAPDAEVSWLADFGENGELAEAFAASYPQPVWRQGVDKLAYLNKESYDNL